MSLRVVSYGGGVQSTALLVLAAQGLIDFPTFLFCNVGDDSENPKTLAYIAQHAAPYAAEHGIGLIELRRARRDGQPETLRERIMRPSRSIDIPVRMSNGSPGHRKCTAEFKIKVVDRWLREHGVKPASPATLAIGFSTDEIERSTTKRQSRYSTPTYPLLGLQLDRAACGQKIRAAGLPVPPKSSCYFCPFHTPRSWNEQARSAPALFADSVLIEKTLSERRRALGKDDVFMTRFGRPLNEVADGNQGVLDMGEDATCDAWSCFT